MAKNAEDKQKWLDAILREREQRESKYHLFLKAILRLNGTQSRKPETIS